LKSKLIFIAIILFLAGCTSSKEVDELKLSYEASLNKMESSKESELYDLKLKLMHLTSKYEELKKDYDLLYNEKSDKELTKGQELEFNDIIFDDKTIRIYTDGVTYLKNGIDCIIEVFKNDISIWSKVWEGVEVTEINIYSPLTVVKDRIYIVIASNLNVLDINTGDIIWTVDDVGSSHIAPIVDSNGCIYIIGQYAPYLTAIDSNGELKWQIESEELYGIQNVIIQEELLTLEVFDKFIVVNKDGRIE